MKRVLQLKFRRLAAAGGKVSFVFRNEGRFCGAWNTKYKLATKRNEKGFLGLLHLRDIIEISFCFRVSIERQTIEE